MGTASRQSLDRRLLPSGVQDLGQLAHVQSAQPPHVDGPPGSVGRTQPGRGRLYLAGSLLSQERRQRGSVAGRRPEPGFSPTSNPGPPQLGMVAKSLNFSVP